MVSIREVRTLGDFVEARILHTGFKNLDAFAREVGIGRPTLYRILNAKKPQDLGSQRSTLERLAIGLRFKEWVELEKAWEENNVFRGLDENADTVPVDLPRYAWDHVVAESAKSQVTPLAWILKRMGLAHRTTIETVIPDAAEAKPPKVRGARSLQSHAKGPQR